MPPLMVEDMPLVVVPDAPSGIVLAGQASLGRAYPLPAVRLAKSSKADWETRGVGLQGHSFGPVPGPKICVTRVQN